MKMKPTISISAYLDRKFVFISGMFKYMNCSPIIFVIALILIDRVQ